MASTSGIACVLLWTLWTTLVSSSRIYGNGTNSTYVSSSTSSSSSSSSTPIDLSSEFNSTTIPASTQPTIEATTSAPGLGSFIAQGLGASASSTSTISSVVESQESSNSSSSVHLTTSRHFSYRPTGAGAGTGDVLPNSANSTSTLYGATGIHRGTGSGLATVTGGASNPAITTKPRWANGTMTFASSDYGTLGNKTFLTACPSGHPKCITACQHEVEVCEDKHDSWSRLNRLYQMSVIGTGTTPEVPDETYTRTDPGMTQWNFSTSVSTYYSYWSIPPHTYTITNCATASPKVCSESTILDPSTTEYITSTYYAVYAVGGTGRVTNIIPGITQTFTFSEESNYPFSVPSPTCSPSSWTVCSYSKQCKACTISGGTVQLLYWPVSRTVDPNVPPWSSMNATSTSATKTMSPNGTVIATAYGTTMTSPSVYISFETAYAVNECGTTVGKPHSGAILALNPTEVSSVWGLDGPFFSTDEAGNVHNSYLAGSFNYADLNWPVPASAYMQQPRCWFALDDGSQTAGCQIILDDYAPVLAVPPEIRALDPEWASCGLDWAGLYDPPRALQPASNAAVPSVPGSDPTSVPAQPAQSPTDPAPSSSKPAANPSPKPTSTQSEDPAGTAPTTTQEAGGSGDGGDQNGGTGSGGDPISQNGGSGNGGSGGTSQDGGSGNSGGQTSEGAQPAPSHPPSPSQTSVNPGGVLGSILNPSNAPAGGSDPSPTPASPSPNDPQSSDGATDPSSGQSGGNSGQSGGSDPGQSGGSDSGSSGGGSDSGSSGSGSDSESSGSGSDRGQSSGSSVSGSSGSGSDSGSSGGSSDPGQNSGSSSGQSSSSDPGQSDGSNSGQSGGGSDPSQSSGGNAGQSGGSGSGQGGGSGSEGSPASPQPIATVGSGSGKVTIVAGSSPGQVVAGSGSGSTTLTAGETTEIDHTPISVDGTGNVVIGTSSTMTVPPNSPVNNPSAVLTVVGSDTVKANPSGDGVVIAGSTLSPGQATTLDGGRGPTISVDPQGSVVVASGGSSQTLSPDPTTPLQVGGESVSSVDGGLVIGGSTTLRPGGAPATIDGTIVSMASNGGLVIAGSSTAFNPSAAAVETAAIFTADGEVFTAVQPEGDSPDVTIEGHGTTFALAPGATTTVDGQIISVGPSGQIVVGASTLGYSAITPAATAMSEATFVVDGTSYTAIQTAGPGEAVIDGTTISLHGPAITLNGETISLASGGIVMHDSSSTQTVPFDTADIPTSAVVEVEALITAGSETLTAYQVAGHSGTVEIDGTLLSVGGPALTISGETISVAPNGIATRGAGEGLSKTLAFTTLTITPTGSEGLGLLASGLGPWSSHSTGSSGADGAVITDAAIGSSNVGVLPSSTSTKSGAAAGRAHIERLVALLASVAAIVMYM